MARITVSNDYYGSGLGAGDEYGGNGANSRFVPVLFDKKILRNFYESTVYQHVCNTDYEGTIRNQGDTVFIRKTPTITVNNYTIGGTITYEVPKEDATSLVIDKALYTAFRVDDVDKAQSDIQLVSMFAKDAAERIKINIDDEILEYMSGQADSSNTGATAGAISGNVDMGASGAPVEITGGATSNAVNKIVDANLVLDEANQPNEGRFGIFPAWYCAMLKTGDLRRADMTGDSTGVLRTGLVGQVDRTMIYQNNNVHSATDGTTGNTAFYALVGTKEATTFAAQISKSDTLQIQDSFGQYWRTLFVYGRKVVQPTALSVLYCERG